MISDIIEQESLVIGALLHSPELFTECDLQPNDFSSVEHRQYFECVQKAAAKNNLNAFEAREIFRMIAAIIISIISIPLYLRLMFKSR